MDTLEQSGRPDYMEYLPDMEQIDSAVMDEVLRQALNYDYRCYDKYAVKRALQKTSRSPEDFAALLSPAAEAYIEEMAEKARAATRRYFGNTVYLFTPLYLANYCENHCVYCGFNCKNQIRRAKLSEREIELEMKAIAAAGLEEILLLTGESRMMSPMRYIGRACEIARDYFRMVGLEIYPLNRAEYAYLQQCGADYVTVFQETYQPAVYGKLHLSGHKRIFPYRFHAQERALQGNMRGVAFGALLGLADFRVDAFATGMHAWLLQRKYPQAEISFSCPRLRPTDKQSVTLPSGVQERQLLQVMLAYRLFMPYAGITISSRERAQFRDNVVGLAATKISAGVSTGIGGHFRSEKQGDEQFSIADDRSVEEIMAAIRARDLQPVTNDYVYV